MCISGLWHGASWNYVAWGALHGIYQIAGDASSKLSAGLNRRVHAKTDSFSFKLGQMTATFVLVDFAWIFFRANGVTNALLYIKQIFCHYNPWVIYDKSLYQLGLDQTEVHILIFSVFVLAVVDYVQYKRKSRIDLILETQCIWFRWLCIAGLFTAVWVWGIYGPAFDGSQFIYFQF